MGFSLSHFAESSEKNESARKPTRLSASKLVPGRRGAVTRCSVTRYQPRDLRLSLHSENSFFFFFPSLSHEVHLSFSSDAGLRSSPSWRLSVADYRWHKKKKKSLLSPDFRQTKRMERHKKRGQVSWISCFSGAKGWTNATSNDRGTVPLVFAEKLNAHYSTLLCNASVTVLGRAGEGELRRLTMQK